MKTVGQDSVNINMDPKYRDEIGLATVCVFFVTARPMPKLSHFRGARSGDDSLAVSHVARPGCPFRRRRARLNVCTATAETCSKTSSSDE